MSETLIRKENWKSDIRLAVTLMLAGEPVQVPDHAFTLRFRVCNGKEFYDCWRDKDGVYHNCKPSNDNSVLMCFLDNHKLGLGDLHCEYYDYAPDADFADGDKLTVVPQVLPIKLVNGAGDDSEQLDAEVVVDLDGVISDARAAADTANAAALAANTAASHANTATENAEYATTAANSAAYDATQAASAANAAAIRADDAATASISLATQAANSANAAANLAADNAFEAERMAARANDAADAATQAASAASQAAMSANTAADAANAAAELATGAAGRVDSLENIVDITNAVVSLANYAIVYLESGGVNEISKGVVVNFAENNEMYVTLYDTRYTAVIRANTQFSVPDGSTLYYNISTGQFYVRETYDTNRHTELTEVSVPLVSVSRGLVIGGKLYDALTDYIHREIASLIDGNFLMSVAVGDTLTEEQMSAITRACNSYGTALKVGGAVASIKPTLAMGYTQFAIRFYNTEVVIRNGSVFAINTIPDATVLMQSDFDDICV